MIREILGQIFPSEYGLGTNVIAVPMETHSAPFTLSDDRACDDCQGNPARLNRRGCNREVLRVDNHGETIDVVNYEQYISQYERLGKTVGEKCDIVMVDCGINRRKIVFCDLCCYSEKYVEPNEGNAYPQGKRAKAYQQMEHSIDALVQQSTTAVNLLTYREKICLFAWRDYDMPDMPIIATRGNAQSNVLVFGSTTASGLATSTTSQERRMGHDFIFKQVKYPSVYNW